ncbi:MAG: hypothetical protein NVS3B16_11710 [Vulcanimicrobiaceae bacterium]
MLRATALRRKTGVLSVPTSCGKAVTTCSLRAASAALSYWFGGKRRDFTRALPTLGKITEQTPPMPQGSRHDETRAGLEDLSVFLRVRGDASVFAVVGG